ncbi:transmembrane protein 272-like isoform X2 [Carettochelys insculpta]
MAEDPTGVRAPLLPGIQEAPVHPALSVLAKILFCALPVASIVIGALYLGQCPCQPLLPHYLLVEGAVLLLLLVLSCLPCEEGAQLSLGALGCRGTVLLFLFAWFIAGNVWVYSIYPPDYGHPGQPRFCARPLYLFAFWLTTLVYVGLGVALAAALTILGCLLLVRAHLPWLHRGGVDP